MLLIFASIVMIGVSADSGDPASNQLPNFKNETKYPIGILTTDNGARVEYKSTCVLNSPLISNNHFMEEMTHFVRQEIPNRVVHAKGAGAFGFFEVTHNVTDICRASLFSKIGKRTPVAVRFSHATLLKGEADTVRDGKGFAVKFYTDEGNFDIPGLNTPMFMVKDPIFFPSFIRTRRNPQTNLKDPKQFWDIVTLRPETVFFLMFVNRDYGIPASYRHIPGHGIHTYQVCNKHGESYFVRWHWFPDSGIKNFNTTEAARIAASDPDYLTRDLYNAIEQGDYPSWSVSIQVLSYKDVKKCKFDPFDVTKVLPFNEYPLRPIGKLVLNVNPTNHFTDMEQLAFCPGNLVCGILGAPDKLFEARLLSDRDAQLYRLGANFHKISVNCPLTKVFSYKRDGAAPVGHNGRDAPNYYPNSYHGPVPYKGKNHPKLIKVTHDTSYNFDQAAEMYIEMTKEERNRMIENLLQSLRKADPPVQQRALDIFAEIHPDLGFKMAEGLNNKAD